MNLSNVSWDLENAGTWPLAIKVAITGILCLVVIGLWYYLVSEAQLAQLAAAEANEAELKTLFEFKQKKAVNLEEYRAQLKEIENTFGDLLRQLPDKTQVPDLLVDISQTGLTSGLEFELFKPGTETVKDFYAELPIEIKVLGDYLEFGNFVSGVASLPRIVTIHNIKISQNNSREARDSNSRKAAKYPLIMSALVKTYRYLEKSNETPGSNGTPAAPVKKP